MLSVDGAMNDLAINICVYHGDKKVDVDSVGDDRNSSSCVSGIVLVLIEAEDVWTCKFIPIKKGIFDSFCPNHLNSNWYT